jgi:hypothetical protein
MMRHDLEERQQRWMLERRAEQERRAAQAEVGAGSSAERVLERITERIAERLQVELRQENAQLMQQGEVGVQVEQFLEKHIGTNTCPICYELMATKEHQPTLLFPCGHTFCASCLAKHTGQLRKQTCPFCRERIASQAPNIGLQQVIEGYVERQQRFQRGETLREVVQGQDAAAAAARRSAMPLGCGGGAADSLGGVAGDDGACAVGGRALSVGHYSEQAARRGRSGAERVERGPHPSPRLRSTGRARSAAAC